MAGERSLTTWLGGQWQPPALCLGSWQMGPALSSRFVSTEGESAAPHSQAISTLRDEWGLCHSAKMNISLR